MKGFTLVEMAIVLLIMGLLSSAIITPLTTVAQHQRFEKARQELADIDRSITAYLIQRGELPCPINDVSSANRLPVSGDIQPCQLSFGNLSASELSIRGATNSQGALLDPWGRPYKYAVSLENHPTRGSADWPDWTSKGEASRVGLRYLSANLQLCLVPANNSCSREQLRANGLAYVVVSQGFNTEASIAQNENIDEDKIFIVDQYSESESNEFDDLLVWASAQDIMYWWLRSGWLP